MTHQFKESDWENLGQAYQLNVPVNVTDDRPIVQVYIVKNNEASPIGVSITITDKIVLAANSIFDGYVVVK